jgi:hypothetical protein
LELPPKSAGPPVTSLEKAEYEDFVDWLLGYICYSTGSTKRGEARVLLSKHACISGAKHLRGSDQSERIFLAVKVLMASGWSEKAACVHVASHPAVHLGRSRRGRPAKKPVPRDLISKAQTVRAIANQFKNPHAPDWINYVVGQFRWQRENGIVVGSRYDPDSGARLVEAAQRAFRRLQFPGRQL